MIAASLLALRTALRDVLLSYAPLTARIGAGAVFDEAPAGAARPYVAFAQVRSRDHSTASGRGAEHVVALELWSQHHGVEEVLEIASLVTEAIDDQNLPLGGYQLVLLRLLSIETQKRDKGRTSVARITFRALVETL